MRDPRVTRRSRLIRFDTLKKFDAGVKGRWVPIWYPEFFFFVEEEKVIEEKTRRADITRIIAELLIF